MTPHAPLGTTHALLYALDVTEANMFKRRPAPNEIPTHCVREDGEGDRCDVEIIVEIDFDPGDRDNPPSRAIHLSGCPHVETYTDAERELVESEMDDMVRARGEQERDR